MTLSEISPLEEPIFTVSELSQHLKKAIEQNYSNVRVRGEISGLKRHSSGHTYFSLKDQDAVIDAVSWRGMLPTNGIQLEEGLEIIATGRLTTYPGRSKYQMIVSHFEAAGLGALLKQLEERKQRLTQEGLFLPDRKKRLPLFPRVIGVITSPTGAVIRDILHRIQDRYPCHIIVWPVLVQGPEAAEQITQAIQGFNKLQKNVPDLLIVARGGGSLEDLWAFNEENVVRAAAESRIPLISAVGHETDTTLIDYAADQRAPTPTAAAEIATPVLMELWAYLQDRQQRFQDVIRQHIDLFTIKITGLARGLTDPKQILDDKMQRLDDWQERLHKVIQTFHRQRLDHLNNLMQRLRHPKDIIHLSQEKLSSLSRLLLSSFSYEFDHVLQSFFQIGCRLDQASYHRQLERGFCRATNASGKTIGSIKDVRPSQIITLHFHDGTMPVVSTASKKKKDLSVSDPQQPRLF